MKIHVLSDIHTEFDNFSIPQTDADIIILAGDIGVGDMGFQWALTESDRLQKPLLYVPGNHEYYHHPLSRFSQWLNMTASTNVHELDNTVFQMGNIRFLGCTLWTDFACDGNAICSMNAARFNIADFSVIMHEQMLFTPEDSVRLFEQSYQWLDQNLLQRFAGKTVVITHHAPSNQSVARYHVGSPLTPAFVSNLDAFIRSRKIDLWIHGHTHHNVDYMIAKTRVITNQKGYPDIIDETFDPAQVIDLDGDAFNGS